MQKLVGKRDSQWMRENFAGRAGKLKGETETLRSVIAIFVRV